MAYNAGVDTEGAFSRLTTKFQQTQAKIAPLTAAKSLEWNGTASTWVKTAQVSSIILGVTSEIRWGSYLKGVETLERMNERTLQQNMIVPFA